MSFNTFVQHIKSEKYAQLGFWKLNKTGIPCNPIHWFQFADDAAVISSQENENQILLNRFTVWSQWANMIIRVDKCSSFGIKKRSSKSIQYQPKLFVINQLIPRIELGEYFRYLGRCFDFNMMKDERHKSECHTFGIKKFGTKAVQYKPIIKISGQLVPPIEDSESFMYLSKQFNFEMDCTETKIEIFDEIQYYIKKIDLIPINPFSKIRVVESYVYSKFFWRFSIYLLTTRWIHSDLDSIISKYIRKWLQIPISGNISHLKLPKLQLGIDFCSPSDIYNQCKLTVRRILRTSVNSDIQQLYTKTS